jgi:hypothetical protein
VQGIEDARQNSADTADRGPQKTEGEIRERMSAVKVDPELSHLASIVHRALPQLFHPG